MKPNKNRRGSGSQPDKETLEASYLKHGGTIASCEREFDVPAYFIKKWLAEYEIPIKSWRQANDETVSIRENKLDDGEVLDFYAQYGMLATCREFNVARKKIVLILENNGVPLKTLGESVSHGYKRNIETRLQDIPNPSSIYESAGHNKQITMIELGVTRRELDWLFEKYSIETVRPQRSRGETDLLDYLRDIDPDGDWVGSDKSVINPFELDIVSHVRRLAVEYCGLYWHSFNSSRIENPSRSRHKRYHREKMLSCNAAGYDLITVFDTDPIEKIRSLLRRRVSITSMVNARSLKLDHLSVREAREFNEEHHLMGHVDAPVRIGLRDKDGSLISMMTFAKPRHDKTFQWEIMRYTVGDIAVRGGGARLFKEFVRCHSPDSVMTYADLRFGTGRVYNGLGFTRVKDSDPNYFYHRGYVGPLYSRLRFQKHKIASHGLEFDPSLTEGENMRNNGYDWIWDCGNGVYHWRRHE